MAAHDAGFDNLLYVSQGIGEDREGLRQAFTLACNEGGRFSAMIVCPPLSRPLKNYEAKYLEFLGQQLRRSITELQTELDLPRNPVFLQVQAGYAPAPRIIHQVVEQRRDLVIKEAEPQGGGRGFRALDMNLLRDCPCAVWLCRPVAGAGNTAKVAVAVAVDPETESEEEHELALRLLRFGSYLADRCSGELQILSCWDYGMEDYLRSSIWSDAREEDLIAATTRLQREHRERLERLIEEAAIDAAYCLHHLRGKADRQIVGFSRDQSVDILVMGTVARSGIPGFVIGNTAENVFQQISCSLVALKPTNFRTT